jgi:hypothetical protein
MGLGPEKVYRLIWMPSPSQLIQINKGLLYYNTEKENSNIQVKNRYFCL